MLAPVPTSAFPPANVPALVVLAAPRQSLEGVAPAVQASPLSPLLGVGRAIPPPRGRSVLRPPGSAVLSDAAAAARVRRSPFEPRPANAASNHRVPTPDELARYRAGAEDWGACNVYHQYVTGDFTGTTDEIIQWAAWKWGLDEDVFRADAVVESYWRGAEVGDAGQSFGLMQIKASVHGGTYPLSVASTAFNADFFAAAVRHYYDGCAPWLNDVERGQTYAAGDLLGALGAWYAGRWHTPEAEGYIAKVRRALAQRIWQGPRF